MGALGLLSTLNWVLAVLYAGVGLFVLVAIDSPVALVPALVMLAVAAPHVYLALVVEQGKGRILQTVLAVLGLLNFPIGTAVGAFALYACWSGESARIFEEGPDPIAAEPAEDDDDTTVDETPYALARRLAAQGLRPSQLRAKLVARGLGADKADTLVDAVTGGRAARRSPAWMAPAQRETPPRRPPARKPR